MRVLYDEADYESTVFDVFFVDPLSAALRALRGDNEVMGKVQITKRLKKKKKSGVKMWFYAKIYMDKGEKLFYTSRQVV